MRDVPTSSPSIDRQSGSVIVSPPRELWGSSARSSAIFTTGMQIYLPGEARDTLYRVAFGGVRICRYLVDGRRLITAFHLTGETFGFECGNRHQLVAEALCRTKILFMRMRGFPQQSSLEVLPLAVDNLTRAHEHLLLLGRHDCSERVALFLLEMSQRQHGSSHVVLPMARRDVADYLGLSPETLSRVLTRMKSEGIIKLLTLRDIYVANWRKLQELAGNPD